MSNYDNFNPTIPETEEIIAPEVLPPLPEDDEPQGKRVLKKEKKEKPRVPPKKKTVKVNKKPFV
ncbi:MAG: hypothetical protein K2J49_00135, partial [Muribaculaceae bacterium]|nr:hypothetical protein [Muribaculaceae bacterium]